MAASWDEEKRLCLFFVNGLLYANHNVDAGKSSYRAMNNSHSVYYIGTKSKQYSEAGGKSLHGLIKELKVFKKALNSSEVLMEARVSNTSGTSDCQLYNFEYR